MIVVTSPALASAVGPPGLDTAIPIGTVIDIIVIIDIIDIDIDQCSVSNGRFP